VRLRRAAEGRLKRDHTRREVIDRAPSTSNGGERITYPASWSQPGPQAKPHVRRVFTPQPALVGYPWAFPVRWLCLLGDAKRRRIETKRPRFRFAFPGEPVFESDDRRSEVFASMAAMAAMKTCEKYGKSSIPKRRSRNGTNKGSCPGLLCTALTTAPTRHTGTSVAASSVFGPRLRLPARV